MKSEHFDLAIVGGGAAGCVLARRLAEQGDRAVVLVEAGPDLRGHTPQALIDGWSLPRGDDWPYDWGYRSEPGANGETSPVRRGRLLGGTSWLTRFAVRGHPTDFDAWAARGIPGWSFDDALPFFKAIEADAEFGAAPWHGNAGPLTISRYPSLERSAIHRAVLEAMAAIGMPAIADHNAPDAVGAGPMPMSTRNGRRITGLDAFLPSGIDLPRLTTRPATTVASIRIDNGRATGLRLIDGGTIDADTVILSAGTYGSPVLLMRSGIGPAKHLQAIGIDVVEDLRGVGSNLADHPGLEIDIGWRGDAPASPVLHSIATFRSTRRGDDHPPDLMFWIGDPAGTDTEFPFEIVLMKPDSRGSVRLRSADPADAPRITLPSLTEPADRQRLADGYSLAVEVANVASIRRLAGNVAPRALEQQAMTQYIATSAYSLPHVVGTCRMGPSAEDGDVVDASGRVHGIDHLYAIDASIIPEATAGFPHLITIMLAERLATAI